MTPSVRTLQGSKQKSFRGSKLLCPRGSNTRGFSNCYRGKLTKAKKPEFENLASKLFAAYS